MLLRRLTARPAPLARRLASTDTTADLDAQIAAHAPSVSAPGAAGKWAKNAYVASGIANKRDVVFKDLSGLHEVLRGSDELADFAQSQIVPFESKQKVFRELLATLKADDLTVRLVDRVFEAKHGRHIATVCANFESMVAADKGEVDVTVTTAKPVAAEEIDAITAVLQKEYLEPGQKVRVQTAVDSKLVGGVTVQMGDTLVDCSLASELKRVEDAMTSAVASHFDEKATKMASR